MRTVIHATTFARGSGPLWQGTRLPGEWPWSRLPAWDSFNQGSLKIQVQPGQGKLVRVHIAGVFAVEPDKEVDGGEVALVQCRSGAQLQLCQELSYGKHLVTASVGARLAGDGASVESVDRRSLNGVVRSLDLITIDCGGVENTEEIWIITQESGTRILIYDLFVEWASIPTCPFRGQSGNISLAELGSIVRVGDRNRFSQSLRQLESGIMASACDLDGARGQALTFLAVVASAMLEMGGTKILHREQLDDARALDRLQDAAEIAGYAVRRAKEMTAPLLELGEGQHDRAVNRALAFLDRNFAKSISDSKVAELLGLSSSHFRFLFRQATDQPFHQYLLGLRLEKARQLLLHSEMAVSEVALNVGFSSPAHFTRTFVKRFATPPSALRHARKIANSGTSTVGISPNRS